MHSLEDKLNKVAEFHSAFGIENNQEPSHLDEAQIMLRYNLMKEENE